MEFSELIKTATVENVLLSRQGLPAVRGTLCISSHHLLLSSCPRGELELWLLIRNVDAVEKRWGCPFLPALEGSPKSPPWGPHGLPAAPPSLGLPLPPLVLRVHNLGWYQPPRTGGSLRDTRCGFFGSLASATHPPTPPPTVPRPCGGGRSEPQIRHR